MSQRRDARLKTRRERDTLSHRLLPIGGAVIEPTYVLGSIHAGQYCSLSRVGPFSNDNWDAPAMVGSEK